jgi:hypothetical protein
MANRITPMEDWESQLNKFIEATDRTILQNAGKVSVEIARAHAEVNLKNIELFKINYLKVILTRK